MAKELSRRVMLLAGGTTVAAWACGDSESTDSSTTESTGGGSTTSDGGSTTSSMAQGGGATTTSAAGGSSAGGNGAGGMVQGACGMALVVRGSNYDSDPHDLMIPVADLTAGVERTYTSTQGGGGHTHDVTLTAADFAALQNGETVTKYSCRTNLAQTDHEWAISCADPNIAPVLEGEFGTEDDCPNV